MSKVLLPRLEFLLTGLGEQIRCDKGKHLSLSKRLDEQNHFKTGHKSTEYF